MSQANYTFYLTYPLFMFLWRRNAPGERARLVTHVITQACTAWHPGPCLVLLHMIAQESPQTQQHLKTSIEETFALHVEHAHVQTYRAILKNLNPTYYPRSTNHLHALWGSEDPEHIKALLNCGAQDGPNAGEGLTPAQYLAWFHPESLEHHTLSQETPRGIWSVTLGNFESGLKDCHDYLPWVLNMAMQGRDDHSLPSPQELYAIHPARMYGAPCTEHNLKTLCSLIQAADPETQFTTLLEYLDRIHELAHIPQNYTAAASPSVHDVHSYLKALHAQNIRIEWPLGDLLFYVFFNKTPNIPREDLGIMGPIFNSVCEPLPSWREVRAPLQDTKTRAPLYSFDPAQYSEEDLLATLLDEPNTHNLSQMFDSIIEHKKPRPHSQKRINASLLVQTLNTLSSIRPSESLIAELCKVNIVLHLPPQSLEHSIPRLSPKLIQGINLASINPKESKLLAQLKSIKQEQPIDLEHDAPHAPSSAPIQEASPAPTGRVQVCVHLITSWFEALLRHLKAFWIWTQFFFKARSEVSTTATSPLPLTSVAHPASVPEQGSTRPEGTSSSRNPNRRIAVADPTRPLGGTMTVPTPS